MRVRVRVGDCVGARVELEEEQETCDSNEDEDTSWTHDVHSFDIAKASPLFYEYFTSTLHALVSSCDLIRSSAVPNHRVDGPGLHRHTRNSS